MVNHTNLIWKYLDRNTDVKRDLARGIVNVRSLAKFILKENPHLDIGITGIVTAIRRYLDEKKFEEKHKALDKIFENTKLEMSFGNAILHLKKTEHSLNALTELFKKLNLLGEDTVNLVMDKSSFALTFDDDHYDLIRNQFNDDKVMKEMKDVGQIVLKFDPAVMETPNVFSTVLNEVGINDINVIDSVTKREKFMIFVKEKDLMNTCNILYKFTKEAKRAKVKK